VSSSTLYNNTTPLAAQAGALEDTKETLPSYPEPCSPRTDVAAQAQTRLSSGTWYHHVCLVCPELRWAGPAARRTLGDGVLSPPGTVTG